MKKLFGAFVILLICYIVFFDLVHGTLPQSSEKAAEIVSTAKSVELSFFEKRVKAGDTVLTIVENRLESPIPVSITEIVTDFKVLNKGITPEKIQIGKTYLFPDYSK
jgi:uncharacterized membrane protein